MVLNADGDDPCTSEEDVLSLHIHDLHHSYSSLPPPLSFFGGRPFFHSCFIKVVVM